MIISIGKCARNYLYILGSPLFKFFSLLLLGDKNISFNENNDGIGLFGFCPTLFSSNFMQSILIYFGYIVFGIIFFFFKKIKKTGNNDLEKRESQDKTFIYNGPSINGSKNLWKQVVVVSLAFVLHIEIKKILYNEGFQFFNFWTVEVLFIQHFMRKYFIVNYYIHHKVAIIFNVTVCSAILITASLLPTSLNSGFDNSYTTLKDKLGSYFYFILFILFFLFLSYIYSFSRVYSKVFMEFKFISPFKIIVFYGIVGFIISLISFGVSNPLGYHDNIGKYIFDMKDVLNGVKPYKFWVEIFCTYPLFSFISFMEIYFEILTIYYLNPFYILMTNTIYYGIIEIIYFLLNISNDPMKILHIIFTELAEVFCLLGLMIYLEILILNFCGLNDKVKSRLIETGEKEFRILSFGGVGGIDFDDDDDEDNEEDDDVDDKKNYNEEKSNKEEVKPEIIKQYRNI